jgi:DNA (cytosine-5)-methyltransferase 1
MLKHVDIFSGIGGFPLGFEWAGLSEPSMFCEIDPWCRQVLRKHWPTVPITNDVKELANDPEKLVPDCDILTGGYPCQPFSVAGKQKAHEDDRHLWPYLYQIITRKRPTYAVLENVYGHIGLGLDTVLLDLEAEGYSTRTFVVPACSVNAPHRRDRLWIVAYSDGKGLEGRKDSRDSEEEGQINNEQSTRCSDRTTVANSDSQRGSCRSTWREDAEDVGQSSRGEGNYRSRVEAWESEPNVGRVANGIPKRVDRLRGLGNAIVPQIAMQIGLTIKEMEVCKKKV